MIDFHVHLLPGVDDGSKNIKMSVDMLKESKRQGIDVSVATPHFYFDKKTKKIIENRNKAYDKLISFCKKNEINRPEIILGFEVFLSEKICDEPLIDSLLISGTNTLLLEMPRTKWNDEVFDRVDYIASKGYDVVLAHPERYASVCGKKEYDKLFSYGFAGQVNAASFVNPASRDIAYHLIKDGRIHMMGSDAHNTGIRAVFMQIASEFIGKNLGEKYNEMMMENAKHYLGLK